MLCLSSLALVTFALAQGDCPYGPDTCVEGYVWREAFTNDHVCVPPATRAQVQADNAAVHGYYTCEQGYVWREASPSDYVCVSLATRAGTARDNGLADSRVVCDCGTGRTECFQQWFGEGPTCDGGCPDEWDFVRSASSGFSCDSSHRDFCITGCVGTDGHSCWTGSKALCQQCVGVVTQH